MFDNVRTEGEPAAHPIADLKRLARHWPVYPALLIWLLWNFAPGSATPLQYYLQNTLHAEDAQWGQWNAIFSASFIPTFMVFGVLCRKLPLRTLLFWGTVVAIPQLVPMLFMDSVTGALIAAVPDRPDGRGGHRRLSGPDHPLLASRPGGHDADDVGGRSTGSPTRFGDVLGTALYDHYGGFTACVIAITVVYTLILPTLLLVPKRLIATADGQPSAFGR